MYSDNEKRKVGLTCLLKARNYVRIKDWARAFPHYLMCLELFPDDRRNFENEFTEVLYQLGIWLEANNKLTDICKWYVTGLRYFPTNAKLLNHFAEHLLRIEEPLTALTYLETAHKSDPTSPVIRRNLTAAKLNAIPRWHFRMLNDRRRNEAFKGAIAKAVSSRRGKVLDIGTGCGLLSFYASQCSADGITAIESSSALAKIAKSCLPRINVVNGHSTSLHETDVGLHDVLVTEIFDATLFGEHALESVIHAWDNLLDASSVVIPHSADLFVTGFSSADLLKRHKLFLDPRLGLGNVCVTQRLNEPYEADNLKLRPVSYVTNTYKACTVSFYDVTQLKDIYNNVDAIANFSLHCVNSGSIDGFAIWFNLYLDEEKTIVITTDPRENNVNCWEQAIICLDHPIAVEQNDEIILKLSCINNVLKLTVLQPIATCSHCFKVSADIITYLNDTNIINTCENFQLSNNAVKILDLNPFPLFALFLAGHNSNVNIKCLVKDAQDIEFINFAFKSNGIDTVEICNEVNIDSSDLIFVNPLLRNGTLDEALLQQLPQPSDRANLFPKRLHLHVEVIESEYLLDCCRVDDRNLLGHKAADLMNEYSVYEHWEIEPRHFSFSSLGTVKLGADLLHEDVSTEVPVTVVTGRTAHGVLYWFTMDYATCSFTTYNSLHYSNACFIFSQPKYLTDEVLLLTVRKENSLLHVDYTDK